MKIELATRKGDVVVELSTEKERLAFAKNLPSVVTEKSFVSAAMIEAEGTARFATLAGLINALKNYED